MLIIMAELTHGTHLMLMPTCAPIADTEYSGTL